MRPLARLALAAVIGLPGALPGTVLAPSSARAASFPCAKAEAADEVAVCADRALSEQDVEMATRFEVLTKLLPMGGSGKLRDDQEAWLDARRACGGDKPCLEKTYEGRLRVLRKGTDELAKRDPQ
jgi:uncharacterized protein